MAHCSRNNLYRYQQAEGHDIPVNGCKLFTVQLYQHLQPLARGCTKNRKLLIYIGHTIQKIYTITYSTSTRNEFVWNTYIRG